MCAMITRIEAAGPERRARRLVFDDGCEAREVSSSVCRELALQEGQQVDPAALEESIRAIEVRLAKARALQLLGYRERSEAELTSKLRASGYPPDVASSVVARFVDVELVDDRRFAFAFARSKAASGYGDRRIARELKARGIPEALLEEVLATFDPSSDELSRARSAMRGRIPADASQARKLVRRLVARGFDLSVAIKAVESRGDFDEPAPYT